MKHFLLMSLLLLLPLLSSAQQGERGIWPFRINRTDKAGKYTGRWKLYLGEGKEEVMIRNGRFRHGKEVGTWKYFYPDGTLYMKEKYNRRSPEVAVSRYHENGKLARAGKAVQVSTTTMDHYYWTGPWQVYDLQGNYTHTEVYDRGHLIKHKE